MCKCIWNVDLRILYEDKSKESEVIVIDGKMAEEYFYLESLNVKRGICRWSLFSCSYCPI